jgi:hypothetical protein
MATSKKPRKQYKPKHVLVDPLAYALEGVKMANTNSSVITRFSLKPNDAFKRLRAGEATHKEIDSLISVHNIMHALKMMKFGEGVLEPYHHYAFEAKMALIRIGVRFGTDKKFIASGPDLTAISDLVTALDEMLGILTVAQLEHAAALAKREIAGKRAIKTYKFPNLIGEEHEVPTVRRDS